LKERNIVRHSLWLLCVSAFTWPVLAADLGVIAGGGDGTSQTEVSGTLDFGVSNGETMFGSSRKDPQKDFTASLDYVHLYTNSSSLSRTDQITGGLSHTINHGVWEVRGNATAWKDSINLINYIGPSIGLTYTWKKGQSEGEEGTDVLSIAQDDEVLFYGTDISESSATIKIGGKEFKIPPKTVKERLTQIHPSLRLDLFLFDGMVSPFVSVGYYFYSQDPAKIENLAGRPIFSPSSGRINSLTGGFLKKSGSTGLSLSLPKNVECVFTYGRDQIATDNSWTTTYEVTLTHTFFEHYKLKAEWSQTIQSGIATNLYLGGLSYLF